MKEYNPKDIEKKWQEFWEEKHLYDAVEDPSRPKFYALMEFPYPSGDGLHTGHVRGYTAMDIVARKRRMQGFNVLYPIGWDAFGLPTENYAIKTGKKPEQVTQENTDRFREQFKELGMSFDWSREINTTDPEYYKWTQWLFLRFLEHGLAYKARIPINWCPRCKIGLANEEVVEGKCERCGNAVEKRDKEQWMLAITKYADRLYDDLDSVDYPDRVKAQQRNWIGRSVGEEIEFALLSGEEHITTIKVFTTRPDTIRGATYLVLSPEHPEIQNLKSQITNWNEVEQYIKEAKQKTDIERATVGREKTGVELMGIKSTNPATGETISVWIADYVLVHYGTGAIMAVPSDDERDREFAEKFGLPIIEDYEPAGFGEFGNKVTRYKLRDWVFSRQRYWGEPIPVIHCGECGVVPVPEEELPVRLPDINKYEPSDTGESPLANISEWVNVSCPKCGKEAKRETDVMPNWAGSSWYFLAYCMKDILSTKKRISEEFAGDGVQDKLSYWMGKSDTSPLGGVDWYNGGMEHTTLHLLYSRFWNKFLFDLGLVPVSEPYGKRTSHGLILAEGGEKMSKSKGNVVNPDDIVKSFGTDTLRLYEMFMGPFEQAIAWSESALVGPRRFLERVWRLQTKLSPSKSSDVSSGKHGQILFDEVSSSVKVLLHQTIKKVSDDIEVLGFNTAISSLMILANTLEKEEEIEKEVFETFLKLLAPFAPHIAEELWFNLEHGESIHLERWPEYDTDILARGIVVLAIQIDGKVRATIEAESEESESHLREKALSHPDIRKWLGDKKPKKIIVIPGKIISIVL